MLPKGQLGREKTMFRHQDLDFAIGEQRRIVSARAGVGGDCGCDFAQPGSYDINHLDQFFDIDAQANFSIAGQAAATITMNPVDQWFVPVAVSMTVTDATDRGLARAAYVTAVQIDGCRQEGVNTPAPTAATTQVIPSQKWDPLARNGCACPVNWAPYTNQGTGAKLLQIAVFNPNPVGITIAVVINVYGRGFTCMPSWLEGSRDPHRKPVPPAPRVPVPPVGTPGTPRPTFTSVSTPRPM